MEEVGEEVQALQQATTVNMSSLFLASVLCGNQAAHPCRFQNSCSLAMASWKVMGAWPPVLVALWVVVKHFTEPGTDLAIGLEQMEIFHLGTATPVC